MLNRTILFAFFLLSFTATHAQPADSSFVSNFDAVLEEHFEGGVKGLLQHFYSTVKYPSDARMHCRSGQLLVKATVSPQGAIQSVQFLNKLGNGIEEEMESVLKGTAGKWKSSSGIVELFFSIGFELEGIAKVNGDMKVVAYGSGAHGEGCESTEDIELKMNKAIGKGKTEKAAEYCEELLRRDPFSPAYNKAYKTLKGTK
ncbi:MAG: hypothetical protein GC192_22435 [Bacteroidetes bacterium]|nr:hypothetical protein [Bacteroidota bacterium]